MTCFLIFIVGLAAASQISRQCKVLLFLLLNLVNVLLSNFGWKIVYRILKCGHLNESYWAVHPLHPCGVLGVFLESVDDNQIKCWFKQTSGPPPCQVWNKRWGRLIEKIRYWWLPCLKLLYLFYKRNILLTLAVVICKPWWQNLNNFFLFVANCGRSGPFPNCLVPLFSTPGLAQNLSYENEFYLHVNGNSFSYERLCTKTRFEKEVQQNSEMACSSWSLESSED